MVYHNVHTDMSSFVRRGAMESIDAYTGAGMWWLKVLPDWLDSVLLAYWASCYEVYEVDDLSVVYAVAGVHLVQVGSSLSNGPLLTVVDVASL
jgi:hypothetical protein